MKNSIYRIKIWTKEAGRMVWDVYAKDDNQAREQMEEQKRILTGTHHQTVTDCAILNPSDTRKARERERIATEKRIASYA